MKDKIEAWMRSAGCHRIRLSGDNFVSTCPFHKDSKPSFAMNAKNGMFICYAGSCGASGGLATFLFKALGYSQEKAEDAAKNLMLFDIGRDDPDFYMLPDYDKRRKPAEAHDDGSTIREAHLGLYDFCPNYMRERGFSKSTLKRWEIGYDMSGRRVTIPVRDRGGKLVGMSKRATNPYQEPKYLHLGFKKGKHLYGEYRKNNEQTLMVMEGQADVLAYAELNIELRNKVILPVATMGTRVTNKQISMMADYTTVILSLDNTETDDDGRATTFRVGEALMPMLGRHNLFVMEYPEGCKDWGDVMEKRREKAPEMIRNIVPYDNWRLSVLV